MVTQTYTFLPLPNVSRAGNIVYFMYSAGRIKIGFSGGVDGRHKQLRTAGAFPPVVLLVINGTIGTEADLHIQFAADRLHGEWFTLSDSLRRYLRARLCDNGLASLDRAEAEYNAHCEAFIAAYKAPPKRRQPRPLCDHGMPLYGNLCQICEQERDFKVLEQLKSGTYEAPQSRSELIEKEG